MADATADINILCSVFRSRQRADFYLFVRHSEGLLAVPADLLARFGEPEQVMVLSLTPGRKLARAKVEDVLFALESNGFYLQLPPSADANMADVAARNEKLSRG